MRILHGGQPGGEKEVLAWAAAAETNSEHPLARAVEDAADQRAIQIPRSDEFTSHTGNGVEAMAGGNRILVGKPGWLRHQGIDLASLESELHRLEKRGETVVAVARNENALGLIGIADTLKDDAAETIQQIRQAGITPVMITGDNQRTASAIADQVGVEEIFAGVMPEDKAANIRGLQQGGQRVMMVGDGINDAPALTQADIGVAIGAGTDIAIESAEIVITGDRLGAVMDARQIGVSSYRKTKQNLVLAFSFNGIGVPAAATGLVSPVWAMVSP